AEEEIDVTRALLELEQRGLVHRKSALSEEEYRFGESLTQEVAYEGLLHKQRRQLHERIAGMLESAGDGGATWSALLAHHYARSDNRAKAVEAFLRAGADAERLPSYATAAAFYRQAWEATEATATAEGIDPAFRAAALRATIAFARLCSVFGSGESEQVQRAARRGRELA